MKVAFTGASGTGKTTLMNQFLSVAKSFGVELDVCDVGSREVIKDLGLENPYDVDILGKRNEFQKLLFKKKSEWEDNHKNFVTDRTHIDNLVYSIMHDCQGTVNYEFMEACIEQTSKYDLVIFCSVDRFHHVGNDPVRVKDVSYHRVYEKILYGLFNWVAVKNQEILFYDAWPSDEAGILEGNPHGDWNQEQFHQFFKTNLKYINGKGREGFIDVFYSWDNV